MIGRLAGIVIAQESDGIVVVDVGGVGYELLVPLGTAGRAAVNSDGKSLFFVHTHVREDAFVLFGFATDTDRFVFRTLIGVSSIGPKTALALLSALPASDLSRAVASKDVTRLTHVPGIGKKTAERLVLELRDRLPRLQEGGETPAEPRREGARTDEILLKALLNMGYRSNEAQRAVDSLGSSIQSASMPELLREALALLTK